MAGFAAFQRGTPEQGFSFADDGLVQHNRLDNQGVAGPLKTEFKGEPLESSPGSGFGLTKRNTLLRRGFSADKLSDQDFRDRLLIGDKIGLTGEDLTKFSIDDSTFTLDAELQKQADNLRVTTQNGGVFVLDKDHHVFTGRRAEDVKKERQEKQDTQAQAIGERRRATGRRGVSSTVLEPGSTSSTLLGG